MHISRRSLLTAASTGALATVAPGLKVARAAGSSNILVVLFLRGASDGLQMVAPSGDPDHIAARPTLKVPSSGQGAGLGLSSLNGVDFYMSPSAAELHGLFASGDLAIVHATGIPDGNRSHFDAQDMMELGIAPGEESPGDGWLTRHIAALTTPPAPFGTISNAAALPVSLQGYTGALAIPDVAVFNVAGGTVNANLIRAVTNGKSMYKSTAANTLNAIDTVQAGLATATTSPGAAYTSGQLSSRLRSLARLIKMDIGVGIATVHQEGWDTHDNQAEEFDDRATEMSKSLKAFWDDLTDYRDRLTIVTMTEFGRRLSENESQGTDHGSGAYTLVLGGGVEGGRIFGTWPGLKPTQLRNGDLQVTTDSRQVIAEVLVKRHGQTRISDVFQGLSYSPLGLVF